MCKEMPVIPVNRVVGTKRIIVKKWRAKEEERPQGVADQKTPMYVCKYVCMYYVEA
jgi:hypothetical protein